MPDDDYDIEVRSYAEGTISVKQEPQPMTTRQRMIDFLVKVAETGFPSDPDRIGAAELVLAHSYGDEDEQAPADEAPTTESGPFFYDTSKWFDGGSGLADPFPWLADAPANDVEQPSQSLIDELNRQWAMLKKLADIVAESSTPPKPAPDVRVEVDYPCGGEKYDGTLNDPAADGTRYTVRVDGVYIGSFCNCSRALNPHLELESEYIKQTIEAVIRRVTT